MQLKYLCIFCICIIYECTYMNHLSKIMTLNLVFRPLNPYFLDETVFLLHPNSSLCLDRIFPSHGTPCSSLFAPVSLLWSFFFKCTIATSSFFFVIRRWWWWCWWWYRQQWWWLVLKVRKIQKRRAKGRGWWLCEIDTTIQIGAGENVTFVRSPVTNSLHGLIVSRLRLITGTDPNVGN